MSEISHNRNYGIDLARVLSMLMVVILHNLLNGGVLSLSSTGGNNLFFWFIENLTIVAVNMFAMITGYLMINRKFHLKKIFGLWIVVWFWSVVTSLVTMLVLHAFEIKYMVKSIFPVVFGQYWYFNAYLVLFLLIPFLNAGFNLIDRDLKNKLVAGLLILFVTVGFINNLFLEKGYSALWLLMMYLIGGTIKQNDTKIIFNSSVWLWTIYILGAVISLVGEYLSIVKFGHVEYWINYNSPIVATQSISLFLALSKLNIKAEFARNFLKKIAPFTFAVYLIDANPYFFNHIIYQNFSFIRNLNIVSGTFSLLGCSVAMFSIFIMLDFFRIKLFNLVLNFKNR
ncbi:acyltransferase [Lactiplantibacillus songbeiensis]|uniref:Acyltransferase n=1 Tax=Lactiplantibacillus songbeiensis TaxID=2559920 RepID=A0ABW4C604_9LACO|nr:acyltransferase family protein [Lactiplantibacillus songbeiensis]